MPSQIVITAILIVNSTGREMQIVFYCCEHNVRIYNVCSYELNFIRHRVTTAELPRLFKVMDIQYEQEGQSSGCNIMRQQYGLTVCILHATGHTAPTKGKNNRYAIQNAPKEFMTGAGLTGHCMIRSHLSLEHTVHRILSWKSLS